MPPLLTFYYLCHLNPTKTMELLRTFYHPDHIGSSSWITDGTGQAIQHLHYLPFGEDWVDQRNSSWNAPYSFSGKEKDAETGYGYFGARYYDSGLSIWLSVDPMSDKYPSMSPYNYCANNPVILVDPDGNSPIDPPTAKWAMGYGNYCNTYSRNMTPTQVVDYNKVKPTVTFTPPQWAQSYIQKQPTNNPNRGGVMLVKKTDKDTYGADQQTKKDVPLIDITKFPTGTGSSTATTIPELFGNFVGFMERGITFAELYLEYQQKVQDQKKQEEVDAYNNGTVVVDYPSMDNKGNWSIASESGVRREDSAATALENTKQSIEANQ